MRFSTTARTTTGRGIKMMNLEEKWAEVDSVWQEKDLENAKRGCICGVKDDPDCPLHGWTEKVREK
jgi:hypothetical protein